ncbi:MAG: VOC family protein [Proteobacteria bacterium]|nr:VOC family protein [Pseudomonadota bacterium]
MVWCTDKRKSAEFLTEILGLPKPYKFGPFLVVELGNGVSLDFHEIETEIASQHYAFLMSEDDFDQTFERIREQRLDYWADPGRVLPGKINNHDGGRGLYFADLNGHLLEAITHPYGTVA